MRVTIIALSLTLSACLHSRKDPTGCGPIRVCSFNIMQFGLHAEDRDLDALADATRACDALFLQEVRVDGDLQQVHRLAKRLDAKATISDEAGHGEGYAVLTRRGVRASAFQPIDALQGFARRPALVHLEAGELDALVVSVHLSWKNTKRRAQENLRLLRWMLEEHDDPDVMILGDFNRYGNGGKTFHVWTEAAQAGAVRVLLEETTTRPSARRARSDPRSTTVGRSRWQYDQIIVSPAFSHELAAQPVRFGTNVGVVPFDRAPALDALSHPVLSRRMSDHRPVWVRLCTNRRDDD